MIVWALSWTEVLAWNLRQAGALWAAWAGGASTMEEAYQSDDGSALIKRVATISQPRRGPVLRLVP